MRNFINCLMDSFARHMCGRCVLSWRMLMRKECQHSKVKVMRTRHAALQEVCGSNLKMTYAGIMDNESRTYIIYCNYWTLYISTGTYTFSRTFLTQRTDIFWTRGPKSSADYRHLPCPRYSELFCLRRHVWQEPPSFPPVPGMPPFAPGMPPFMDPSFAMMGMPPPWAMGSSICRKVSVLY